MLLRQSSKWIFSTSLKAFVPKSNLVTTSGNAIMSNDQKCNSSFPKQQNIKSKTLKDQDLEEFHAVGKIICKDFADSGDKATAEADKWCAKFFDYNLLNMKQIFGLSTVKAYKMISPNVTSEDFFSACVLGWCAEMMVCVYLITDDIADESSIRDGHTCWYKQPGVGLMAINDYFFVHNGAFKILKKYFEGRDFYPKLVNEFIQVTQTAANMQCMNLLTNPPIRNANFGNFSTEMYQFIAESEGSYMGRVVLNLVMHLIGNENAEEFEITKHTMKKIGLLYSVQDDYADLYGNTNVSGKKLGIDIWRGLWSWFAVTFLEHANDSQKREWRDNYGKANEKSVLKVMDLYKTLNMREKYLQFEKNLCQEIESLINNKLSNKAMQEFHYYFYNMIAKNPKY